MLMKADDMDLPPDWDEIVAREIENTERNIEQNREQVQIPADKEREVLEVLQCQIRVEHFLVRLLEEMEPEKNWANQTFYKNIEALDLDLEEGTFKQFMDLLKQAMHGLRKMRNSIAHTLDVDAVEREIAPMRQYVDRSHAHLMKVLHDAGQSEGLDRLLPPPEDNLELVGRFTDLVCALLRDMAEEC